VRDQSNSLDQPLNTFGFDIADKFRQCPIWWQNFVTATREAYESSNPNASYDELEQCVDDALARDYNGKCIYRKGRHIWKRYGWLTLKVREKIPMVIFEEENMALWFKMRWS
jgi:hypothetical protein